MENSHGCSACSLHWWASSCDVWHISNRTLIYSDALISRHRAQSSTRIPLRAALHWSTTCTATQKSVKEEKHQRIAFCTEHECTNGYTTAVNVFVAPSSIEDFYLFFYSARKLVPVLSDFSNQTSYLFPFECAGRKLHPLCLSSLRYCIYVSDV